MPIDRLVQSNAKRPGVPNRMGWLCDAQRFPVHFSSSGSITLGRPRGCAQPDVHRRFCGVRASPIPIKGGESPRCPTGAVCFYNALTSPPICRAGAAFRRMSCCDTR